VTEISVPENNTSINEACSEITLLRNFQISILMIRQEKQINVT